MAAFTSRAAAFTSRAAAASTSAAGWSSSADLPRVEDLPGGWKQDPGTAGGTQDPGTADTAPVQPSPPQVDAQQPQAEPTSDEPPPKRRRRHYPPRKCRICLEEVQPAFHFDTESTMPAAVQSEPRVTYVSEDGGRLFSPCRCKGSQKYVHEDCLSAWRRADPLQKRNYWECPTCRYRYKLQRMTWSSWISSTTAQVALTVLIFLASIFVLGFLADPIINMYIDPVTTISTAGGPRGSLIFQDQPVTWTEHLVKGLASLGLLGFAKFMLTLSPFQWFNVRTGGLMGGGSRGMGGTGGTGRDRMQQLSWITIVIGISTFLWAVWKGVRAWSRRTLQSAGERVMDVPGGAGGEPDEHAPSRPHTSRP